MINLESLSFGDRVAESESSKLSGYFVETQQWKQLKSGKVDIILGAKGSGKSALYTLLLQQQKAFLTSGCIVISSENPTGQTVFADITNEPPTSENQFITLWKIYLCQVIVKSLMDDDLCHGEAYEVASQLIDANLIEENSTLRSLVNGARNYAKRLFSVASVEAGTSQEGILMGKITFREPSPESKRRGFRSIDELIEKLNKHLASIDRVIWVLYDRLDVAFDRHLELETNALRALFRVYRDIEPFDKIRLKIFLRDDIWRRITSEGFREASHITRSTTITWSDSDIMNLIVSRALDNTSITDSFGVSRDHILNDYDKQVCFYYKLFPEKVDIGEKQSRTFDWVNARIKDGLGFAAPRELIHFYNEAISREISEQQKGNNYVEDPNIVSRQSIKNACTEVSKVRTEQTLFAEYPELRIYITAFENEKAEHTIETLKKLWGLDQERAFEVANSLTTIGFFDQKLSKQEGIYKVPFLYRFYLSIVQGRG